MFSLANRSLLLMAALLHHSANAWHLYEEARSPGNSIQSHQTLLSPNEKMFTTNQQQQALGALSAGIAELAVNSLAQQAAHERATNMSSSSIVGRILEAALPEKATAASTASNVSEKLGSANLQRLKARKPTTNVDSIEQKIINQHASHHRLIASKHRDNKVANSIVASVSDSRDSPIFSSLFDALKSGATSRSSIVKAISDNKLSRTLSEVGKSISGNKYVAGAAFASAIAALGLTVSKLMSPYLFGQPNSLYPKLGADLMSSDSALRPQMMAGYGYPSPYSVPALGGPNNLQMSYDNGIDSFSSSSASESPTFLAPKPMAKLSTGEAVKQADTNGYYSSYYLQQPDGGETLSPIYYSGAQYQPTPMGDQASELAQSGSLESPVFATVQQVQKQPAHQYSSQPAYLAAGGSRRSGAMTLRLDEATKMQLYEQLKRQYLQQQQQVTRTNEKPLVSLNQQYVTVSKPYAPSVGVGQQQGQRLATTVAKSGHLQQPQTPAYLIIRPKTTNQSLAPEAAQQSPWRSFDDSPAAAAAVPEARPSAQVSQVRLGSSGWQSVSDSNSQSSLAQQEAQQVQQAPQTTQQAQQAHQQTTQQAGDSPAAGRSRQQVNREVQEKPSGAVVATNGAAEPTESQLLQRVSRTTSSSSVKANRPTTSLTDYESLGVSPSKQVAFSVASDESPQVAQAQIASPPQAITMISRPLASNAEGYNDADDSKANLVQLSVDDSGANNDVKLIEANTKSSDGDRLADFDSGLVIMLPAMGQQGAQSERATSMRASSPPQVTQQVAEDRGGKTATDSEADAESVAANAFSGFVAGSLANHH